MGVCRRQIREAADYIDALDMHAAQAGDEGELAHLHARVTPEADGLRLGATLDQRQKFGLEEKHAAIVAAGCDGRNGPQNKGEIMQWHTQRMRQVALRFGLMDAAEP